MTAESRIDLSSYDELSPSWKDSARKNVTSISLRAVYVVASRKVHEKIQRLCCACKFRHMLHENIQVGRVVCANHEYSARKYGKMTFLRAIYYIKDGDCHQNAGINLLECNLWIESFSYEFFTENNEKACILHNYCV